MKKVIAIALILCCLLALCACGKEELALYILPGEQVGENLSATELGSHAKKQGRLALKGEDFAGVDWEQQRFALRPEAVASVSTVTAESGGSSLLKTTDKDVFVWVLGGKALYYGGFKMGISNPDTPKDMRLSDKERYMFSIDHISGKDRRFDKNLYKWFYNHGLIKSELN